MPNKIKSENVVGMLSQEIDECPILWKIPNYTEKLSDPASTFYDSPDFTFSDRCWFLRIYPNGFSSGYTGLDLCFKGEYGCTITFTLGIRNAEGVAEFSRNCECKFDGSIKEYGQILLWQNSPLIDRKSELLPDDTLTIECRYKRDNSSLLGDAVALRDDFEAMYQTGEFCDFDVKVQDRIFRTHKMVLAARSPVLASMLRHDMKEKKTGMVEIVDCDSETFGDFLKFLYCGKYDVIVPKNVISLYEVANKYLVQNLKAKCLFFMIDNLSTEVFCDLMCLALKHDDRELITHVKKYLILNKKNIFLSEEWRTFLKENPIYANELLIKICD